MTDAIAKDEIRLRIVDLEHDRELLDAKIEVLRSILRDDDEIIEQTDELEPELGNGRPPADSAKPVPKAGVKRVSKYPPLIREVLLKQPLSQSGIALQLGNINQSCFSKQMQAHPWFEKVDGLWTLTEAGRTGS